MLMIGEECNIYEKWWTLYLVLSYSTCVSGEKSTLLIKNGTFNIQ